MSTFAELAAWPGVGVNYLLDISTDRFATVSYRYSLTSQSVSGNMYEGRIVDMGKLQRGFGVDGLYAAGTVSLRLDNADGSLDWLTAATTVESSVLRARFRLTLVLFDPSAPSDYATKELGVFTCLDYPRRDDVTVSLSLADDALGDAAELAAAPTYEEWAVESGQTLTEYVVDPTRPVQLVFGGGGALGYPIVRPYRSLGAGTTRPMVLYATTQPDAAGSVPPDFWVSSIRFASGIDISPNPGNTSGTFLFEVQTAGPITKDGRDWYVHWVQLNISEWWNHPPLAAELLKLNLTRPSTQGLGVATVTNSGSTPDDILDALGPARAYSWPGSSRSYEPVNTTSSYDGIGFGVTGSDVVYDLLTHYCAMPTTETSARIVTATFDAVRDAWPGARVQGVIADGDASATANGEEKAILQSGRLRGVLRDICRATQMDLYAGWDGKLRLAGATATYDATVAGNAGTLQRIEETRCLEGSVKVAIPSPGERWAPYNRLYFTDTEGRTYGPYDNGPNVTSWGRAIAKTIDLRWSELWYVGLNYGLSFATGQSGWAKASGQMPLESKVRPVVTFEYPLEALLLDLGDYFVMSVTRGGNTSFSDSYVDAIWRVESMALQPLTGYVTVTAVLSSDLLTETAYLLDDETLNVLADSGTYAGDPQVTDSSDVVTFTGGDLTVAGVDRGDILILEDATQAATVFTRFRGLRINEVTGGTTLVLDAGESLDFSSAGGTTVTTWRIVRGKTRLPASGTNYSDGSYMYGANVVSGEYSDASAGNRFKAG